MKHFIEAERSGNWTLHLGTIKKMLPIFHASDEPKTKINSSLFAKMQDIVNLEKVMPEELHLFTVSACFTVR